MEFLTALWLPILLSAVFVFIASSLIHMVLQIHKGEYQKMPGEDDVLEQMRNHGLKPGQYMFPGAESMKDCENPEFIEKCKLGPVGFMTVKPSGVPSMGKSLLQWFLYCLLIGIFAAYLARFALGDGANYMDVFRITGTVAFLGYGVGAILDSVWKGAPWSATCKFLFDGLVYALVTAGTFGWLWP